MKRVMMIALGILSAIGGFVDAGDLVFNIQAGARFGFSLIWVVAIGVLGIIVYSEMCGRVAATSGRAVFDVVRERMGHGPSLATLIAAQVVSLMTLVAEIGGMAISVQLLSGLNYRLLLFLAFVALVLVIWFVSFNVIENVFSLCGLSLLVFAVAAVKLHPHWSSVAQGAIPSVHHGGGIGTQLSWGYFVIGLLGAAMTPYEVYFYSSGAIEDHWTLRELSIDKVTAIMGYGLGGFLSVSLMVCAAMVLKPLQVSADHLGTVALTAHQALGVAGLAFAAIGMFFATGGAAIETSLSGAYNLAQHFGWEWGTGRTHTRAPRFTITWVVLLVIAVAVAMSGVDPVKVTEYSVIFSTVALPLTYLPILLVANDPTYMGSHTNGRVANVLGSIYLVVIAVIAIAAVPLWLLSKGGTA